jgi:transcriptional regulator with XRE-family HTH domain
MDVLFRHPIPIGAEIRRLRQHRKTSALLLAQLLHCSESELYMIEAGKRPISLQDVQRLDRILRAHGRLLKVACEAILRYAAPEPDPLGHQAAGEAHPR